jgi:hypothetical protein
MNKLDGKVIVDRDLFRALYLLARNSDTGKLREADAATCRELWNQDLTGWAAVPVMLTGSMFNNSHVDSPFMVTAPIGVVAQHKWLSILNASPPLPGGGE